MEPHEKILAKEQQVLAVIAQAKEASINSKRVVSEKLYTTYRMPVTAERGDYPVFKAGNGEPGQGFVRPLTWRETNLETGGKVPQESAYLVHEIGIHFDFWNYEKDELLKDQIPLVAADFLRRAVFAADMPDYSRKIAKCSMLPGGGGLTGYSVVNNTTLATNGGSGQEDRWKLHIPIIHLPSSTIQYNISIYQQLLNELEFDVIVEFSVIRVGLVISG